MTYIIWTVDESTFEISGVTNVVYDERAHTFALHVAEGKMPSAIFPAKTVLAIVHKEAVQ